MTGNPDSNGCGCEPDEAALDAAPEYRRALGNVAVMVAAGAVALTSSRWPDLAAGAVIALLFLGSASGILRQAVAERREAGA